VHGRATDESDLALLIAPTPETTLFDIGAIRHELLGLLGAPVDVVTPKALPPKSCATMLSQAVPHRHIERFNTLADLPAAA